MNNKQTAVDWLVKQLSERGYIQAPSFGHSIIDKAIEQAKEMEKQQIMQSYSDGLGNGIAVGKEECSFESVCDEEQYYKETYED
jgi:hypothetical protein